MWVHARLLAEPDSGESTLVLSVIFWGLHFGAGNWQGERLAQLRAEVPGVTVLRWIRGIPPYCLGAVANTNIRYELRRVCGLSNASVVK